MESMAQEDRPPDVLLSELQALLTGHWLTDMANFSAFFFDQTRDINWIGFYLSDGRRLRLGPFAGKPACVEIAFDRGVCGAAFTRGEPLRVDDVHAFPGHITCDTRSRSEMVLPLHSLSGRRVGVLDIDSPSVGRFSQADLEFYARALALFTNSCKDLDQIANPITDPIASNLPMEALPPLNALRIQDLELQVRIGCSTAERENPQLVRVSVELRFMEPPRAVSTDNLDETICYARIAETIRSQCEGQSYQLIERMALEVYRQIRALAREGVQVAVHIHKVHAPVERLAGGSHYQCGDFLL